MPRKFKLTLVACIVLFALFLTACEPYTVEGTVVGKVYEPAHSETSMIPAGKVIVPLTNQVGDKWYIEIAFSDNDGNAKIFYWGVTKEAYDNYKTGDKTFVNVEGDSGPYIILIPLAVALCFCIYGLLSFLNRRCNRIEVNDDEIKDSSFIGEKDKSKLFW